MGRFVSFAQNLEDVFVDRCFGTLASGFYIDVGASSAVRDSVTFASYLRGWRGVNIEPVPERVAELRRLRPRDHTIQAVAGTERGTARLYRTEGVGGLSSLQRSAIQGLIDGRSPMDELVVDQVTLTSVCAEHAPADIHYLKIDVEGAEMAVIAGLDLERFRPWLLIIEAVDPVSHADRSSFWQHGIEQAGYSLAFNDGLNRYFVREDRLDLLKAFATPVSVLDRVVRFADQGSALDRTDHPDHAWARGLAGAFLRFVASATPELLMEIASYDMPRSALDAPATLDGINKAHSLLLGGWVQPTIAEALLNRAQQDGLTLRTVFSEMLDSEGFALRLAKASAWA